MTERKRRYAAHDQRMKKFRKDMIEHQRRAAECRENRERRQKNRQPAKLSENDRAAQDAFNLIEADFQAYKSIKIAGAMKAMSKAINETTRRLKDLEVRYLEIGKFHSHLYTIAALYRIGHLYQLFAVKMYEAPIPEGLGEEESYMYRVMLEDRTLPIEDKAMRAFEFALKKARELGVDNQWTDRLLMALNQYKPSEYPICP